MVSKSSVLLGILGAVLLTGCANVPESSNTSASDMTYTGSGWAYKEVVAQDWPSAETKLEAEVAANPEDPFRLLNLAFVYSKMDRSEEAAATYERVLDLDANPWATLTSGQNVRAKKVAKDALTTLGVSE